MIRDGGEVKNTRLINESLESSYIVDPFNDEPATNRDKITQMKKEMHGILKYSLTKRQRQIFKMYYSDGIKMPEIAKKLNISKTAVFYNLEGAKKKIKRNIIKGTMF
jgi:RNA polymerase sigma factor (sigma-70 family)